MICSITTLNRKRKGATSTSPIGSNRVLFHHGSTLQCVLKGLGLRISFRHFWYRSLICSARDQGVKRAALTQDQSLARPLKRIPGNRRWAAVSAARTFSHFLLNPFVRRGRPSQQGPDHLQPGGPEYPHALGRDLLPGRAPGRHDRSTLQHYTIWITTAVKPGIARKPMALDCSPGRVQDPPLPAHPRHQRRPRTSPALANPRSNGSALLF